MTPKVIAYSADGRVLGVGGRGVTGAAVVALYDAESLAAISRQEVGAVQTVTAIDVVDAQHVVAGTTGGNVAIVGMATPVVTPIPTGREIHAVSGSDQVVTWSSATSVARCSARRSRIRRSSPAPSSVGRSTIS